MRMNMTPAAGRTPAKVNLWARPADEFLVIKFPDSYSLHARLACMRRMHALR